MVVILCIIQCYWTNNSISVRFTQKFWRTDSLWLVDVSFPKNAKEKTTNRSQEEWANSASRPVLEENTTVKSTVLGTNTPFTLWAWVTLLALWSRFAGFAVWSWGTRRSRRSRRSLWSRSPRLACVSWKAWGSLKLLSDYEVPRKRTPGAGRYGNSTSNAKEAITHSFERSCSLRNSTQLARIHADFQGMLQISSLNC